MFHVHLNVYWVFFNIYNVLKISIKSKCSGVSFRISVALLIFCLENLSIDMSRLLKSLTIVFLSISPFSLYLFCVIGCSYIGCMYVECNILFLCWFFHYIVSFFIFLYDLCFQVHYCYPCFLIIISVCMKYLYPSAHFQSVRCSP